ncbi:MAG: DUF2804 domain-containing protein, partial [Treponema sp.]|nr:DUF2804 domain-containing protein [Treponema sp.]
AGTWNKAFSQVNLLDIHRPYSWPLPRWLKNSRVKEWETFNFQDEHFFLSAVFGNFKIFQVANVFLYNKENGENYLFRKFVPANTWRLPRNLNNAFVECRSSRFFFRIHPWLNANTIKLDINIAKTKRQPALTAHFALNMSSHDLTPIAVSLNFTEQRNMYAFKALAAVRGDIVLGDTHAALNQNRCSGVFCDYKGYYPYRMKTVFCCGMGFDESGRRFGFHIAENQAKETRKNNENALWVNGQLTPLPPVRITMPNGPKSDWVIQDIEGMVDLVFTPKIFNQYNINILLPKGDFFSPIGYYNGMLVNAREEQVHVRNLWGIGEKLYIRV